MDIEGENVQPPEIPGGVQGPGLLTGRRSRSIDPLVGVFGGRPGDRAVEAGVDVEDVGTADVEGRGRGSRGALDRTVTRPLSPLPSRT